MDTTGQMTIFDFLPQPDDDLETLPEEEMVRRISEAIGMTFKPVVYEYGFKEYVAKISKHEKYTIQYDNYLGINDNRRFIGVGWTYRTSGGGSPCDSVQEAVDWFKRAITKSIPNERKRLEEIRQKEAEYRKKYNLDY